MRVRSFVIALGFATIALVACGGDGDSSPTSAVADQAGEGPAIAGSVGDDLLLVPRDYLQGVWCDSDGQTWTIEGDTARFDDGSGGVGEFPVDLAFIARQEDSLVSQTDDEFVIRTAFDEVTYQRGNC